MCRFEACHRYEGGGLVRFYESEDIGVMVARLPWYNAASFNGRTGEFGSPNASSILAAVSVEVD